MYRRVSLIDFYLQILLKKTDGENKFWQKIYFFKDRPFDTSVYAPDGASSDTQGNREI
jgi:hypothetical protein